MIQRKRTEGEIRQALAQEKELLDNLLSNAIKYSPAGSNVRLTLHRSVEHAILKISDRGIGIPSEDQKRLFETFHRATNVGTIPGTGLG